MKSDCMRRAVRHEGFHSVSPRLYDLILGGRKEKVKDWFIATGERMSMVWDWAWRRRGLKSIEVGVNMTVLGSSRWSCQRLAGWI